MPKENQATIRVSSLVLLAVLLVLPLPAIWRLAAPFVAPWLTLWLLLASAITGLLYVGDKRRAGQGGRRTPESVLHLWSLLGGWPGAWLAQQGLRHKTAKLRFLAVFWLTILLHQLIALDLQLHGRIFKLLRGLVLG